MRPRRAADHTHTNHDTSTYGTPPREHLRLPVGSSGNTGLGLAMVCAAKGYPFVCVMSEAFSIERRKMMRFLGAKVVLTNPAHKFGGMVQVLMALREQHGWYWPNQFESEANAWIHRQTTGPEIVQAFEGERLDWFVTAYGTGGTLGGVAQVLR